MQVNVVKLSSWRVPRQFIKAWLDDLKKELKKATDIRLAGKELTLAFVDETKIRQLNKDFRKKDKVTDILSFSPMSEDELGELALCGTILDRQAVEHEVSKNEELGYLLIHGILHLLGYEHEQGGAAAKEMFALQDSLFDILRKRHFKS